MDIKKYINLNVDTNVDRILDGTSKTFKQNSNEAVSFANDFVRAEMTNMTNESSNPWKWKKGEQLHQWTKGKLFEIVKVEKYPSNTIWLKPINK